MVWSTFSLAQGVRAAVCLALTGRVSGITMAGHATLDSRSFRSTAVPYTAIMASHEAVSSLSPSLALGHFLAYVPSVPVTDDVLLFLPGSGQSCDDYSQLLETLAGSMRTLCLPYDNRTPIAGLCEGGDASCYPELRLEAYNGSFSDVPGNNIELRMASALAYLVRNDGGAWSRYLDASGRPLWSQIRAAGHSQGAGAAAYIGYIRELPRVVQFSGVCDMSDWTRRLGPPATPESRFFGFASSHDAMCPANRQVTAWRAEGALPGGARPLQLRIESNLTITSLGKSQTVISNILPPGCGPLFSIECGRKAHASTSKNTWPDHSPYADGLWQALCGV
mmetsp:Transcript_14912/g.42838  ORF Transcript_14912/g.42838 Transcript_14912/m.42838 type:complete len:336 (-) Transcript_14912:120-1127(-)